MTKVNKNPDPDDSTESEKILSRKGYTMILDTDFLDARLTGDELIILRKLISLCKNKAKACTASNEHLAAWRNTSKRNIENWVKNLKGYGLIASVGRGLSRTITITKYGYSLHPLNHQILRNQPPNMVVSTTKSSGSQPPNMVEIEDKNKIIKRKRKANSLSIGQIQIQGANARSVELLQWFNECLKRLRLNEFEITEKRIQAAAALLKSYPFADVTRIIKFKCLQWRDEEKMRPYLRPDTLFKPGLFAKYLEEVKDQPRSEWKGREEDNALPTLLPVDKHPY